MIRISGHSDDVVSIEGDVEDETEPGHAILIGTVTAGVRVIPKYAVTKDCPKGTPVMVGKRNLAAPIDPATRRAR